MRAYIWSNLAAFQPVSLLNLLPFRAHCQPICMLLFPAFPTIQPAHSGHLRSLPAFRPHSNWPAQVLKQSMDPSQPKTGSLLPHPSPASLPATPTPRIALSSPRSPSLKDQPLHRAMDSVDISPLSSQLSALKIIPWLAHWLEERLWQSLPAFSLEMPALPAQQSCSLLLLWIPLPTLVSPPQEQASSAINWLTLAPLCNHPRDKSPQGASKPTLSASRLEQEPANQLPTLWYPLQMEWILHSAWASLIPTMPLSLLQCLLFQQRLNITLCKPLSMYPLLVPREICKSNLFLWLHQSFWLEIHPQKHLQPTHSVGLVFNFCKLYKTIILLYTLAMHCWSQTRLPINPFLPKWSGTQESLELDQLPIGKRLLTHSLT